MFKIYDGRTHFWQWDSGQKLVTTEVAVGTEVHFTIDGMPDKTLVSIVKNENGKRVCKVPDEILMHDGTLKIYIYVEDTRSTRTVKRKTFMVKQRAKPLGYARSSSEVYTLKRACKEVMNELIEAGDLTVDDAFFEAVEKRIENAKSELEGSVEQAVSDIINAHVGDLKAELESGMNIVVDDRLDIIKRSIEETFTEVVEEHLEGVRESVETSAANTVSDKVNEHLEAIKEEVNKSFTAVIEKRLTDVKKELDGTIADSLSRRITTIKNEVGTDVNTRLNNFKTENNQNLEAFKTGVEESIGKTVNEKFEGVKEGIIESVEETIKEEGVPRMDLLDKEVENDPDYKFAYDFANKYNRVYVEKSGGGWGGTGGGLYNKYVLTKNPFPVYDPDTIDYELDENGVPCGETLDSVVMRDKSGHIFVPERPEDYESSETQVGRMQAVSVGYLEAKTDKLKEEIKDDIEELKADVNDAAGIKEQKQDAVVCMTDVSPLSNGIVVQGPPNTDIYMRSVNCAPGNSVYSVGTTGWLAQIMECHPAKGVTYRFSCDFVNRGNATRVGIAVKPDMNGIAEVYSSARSGTLTLDVEMTNYMRMVGLYFYSNFTSSAVSSEAEFTNIVFTPISLVEEGMACVSEEKFRLDDNGQVTIPVPRYSPITINTMDGSVLTATYNRDISKYFATPEYVDGLANKTLVNAKEYTNSAVEQGMGMALMNAGSMDMQVLEDAKNYADSKFDMVTTPELPLSDAEVTQVQTVYKKNSKFNGTYESLQDKPYIPSVATSISNTAVGVPTASLVHNYLNRKLNLAMPGKLDLGAKLKDGIYAFGMRIGGTTTTFLSLGVHYIELGTTTSLGVFASRAFGYSVEVIINKDGSWNFYKNGNQWTSSDGSISLYGVSLGAV